MNGWWMFEICLAANNSTVIMSLHGGDVSVLADAHINMFHASVDVYMQGPISSQPHFLLR